MKRTTKSARVLALVAVLGLVAAACGDDDDEGSSDSTAEVAATAATETAAGGTDTTAGGTETTAGGTETTAGPTDDPLGTPNPASGEPVRVGYIGDGQSPSIDNTDELLTAQAVAEYANEYLGGVGGRPLELVTCETKQDAALATDCANQMLEEDVVAVMFNVSGQSSSIAAPLQEANMPLFAWQAADIATDTESTFVFSNGLSAFLLPAAVARDEGLTRAATLVIDVPGATGPAQSLGVGMLAKAGVTAPDVVPIAPGTADMGPQVQAELTKDPELVHIIGDSAFCITALQALDAAGYEGIVTVISQCIDDSTVEAVGDFLDGVVVAYSATVDPTDADYQNFLAIVENYVDDPSSISLTSNPVGAYGAVMGFVRLMADVTGDITQESVIERAKTAPELPLPLGAGGSFKCDGTAVAILPALCTGDMVIATLGPDGTPSGFSGVDPGDLMVLG